MSVDTVLGELDKLAILTVLPLPANVLDGFGQRETARWTDRFDVTIPSALAVMPEPIRLTLTAARAAHDASRVNNTEALLVRLAEAALANPDGIVFEVLFPVVPQDVLRDDRRPPPPRDICRG